MDPNFKKCMAFVLKMEGGYWDDPSGGPTKFGISQKWHPKVDVKNLTIEQAIEIYYTEYWLPNDCDVWEWPTCLLVFDTAVNQGAAVARRLQHESTDWRDFLFRRIRAYVDLKGQVMEGWLNRVLALYEFIKKEGAP